MQTRLLLFGAILPAVAEGVKINAAKEKKNALVTICFADKDASWTRHPIQQYWDGCLLNIASFKTASPDSDVLLITPSLDMIHEKIKTIAAGDSSVKLIDVGEGPWKVLGEDVYFADQRTKKYIGNGIRHVWYSNVLEKYKDDYDEVFIGDGVDVYFQRDMFGSSGLLELHSGSELVFFGDRADRPDRAVWFFHMMLTENCKDKRYNNETFIEEAKASFQEAGYKLPVYANGGMILGKAAALLSLTSQVKEIAHTCGFWTSDQSFMNVARYREIKSRGKERVLMFQDQEQTISTGRYKWKHYTDAGEFAKKDTNEPLYVVHQWDRSPQKDPEKEVMMWQRVAPYMDRFKVAAFSKRFAEARARLHKI